MDPSCLSCLKSKKVPPSQKEFEREERPPSPIVVDGEEEYEVEAILRHKGKGARRLYLVMWKGYPIIEASWEPELHLSKCSSDPGGLLAPRRSRGSVTTSEQRRPEEELMVALRSIRPRERCG